MCTLNFLCRSFCIVSLLCLLSWPFDQMQAQTVSTDQIKALKYRHLGPVGNRLVAVAGVEGNDQIYFAGAASGGIWKTTDGGLRWKPVFDKQPVHAIGALALTPSNPEIVWAGTGEPFIRSNVSIGNGVWKSLDGGETWNHRGLDNTGRISRIIVHPANPDVVYVAAVGHGYLPQPERGIFRTTDGGVSWEHILHVNDSTGASDLVMDPNNPNILLAGMWQLDIKTWTRESGGTGSGIFISRDGGDTWKRLKGNGLPMGPVGKIALAMTPANSERIYALIETGDGVPWHGKATDTGELWRSDDGGKKWQVVSHNRDLGGRQAYYTRCAVSTDDADEVYFLAAAFSKTTDGGKSAVKVPRSQAPNWDHHDMWIDPSNGNRMAVAGDGGVSISENRGKTWLRVQLPVAQLYHVTVDNNIPYYVYANRQDGPSMRGPSRTLYRSRDNAIPRGDWHGVGGGESGFATPDPEDPDLIWSSASGAGAGGGIVVRYNEKTRQMRQVTVWPESTIGWPAEDLKYRFQWTFPLLISPHDNNTVYVTSQHVHRTTNGGQSWEEVSPDLTTNDKSLQGISGGLTPDNIGVEYGCVIYAFDESPVQQGVLWAGTNDGLVHVSRDGGSTWKDVTKNIPGLPPLGTVRNIDASKWDAGKAYITVDFHQVGNFDPYVYKTDNFGRSWTKITDGIMQSNLSYCRNVLEDPVRQGLLYLGTENALYISFDDGANWQSLMTNLPYTPMYWLQVQEQFNDLVIGTYGRGIWVLDDITPYQQLTPEVAASPAYLFEPRDVYRFRQQTSPMYMFDDPSVGINPPAGAPINYWLSEDAQDSVQLIVTNSEGDTIRKIKHLGKAGINRVWWDLNGELTRKLEMRTPPQHADWVELNKQRTRPVHVSQNADPVQPGAYSISLVTPAEVLTQTIDVIKDPNSEGSLDDIAGQTALLTSIRSDFEHAVDMVNEIELLRRQMYDIRQFTEESPSGKRVSEAVEALDAKLLEIEGRLIQLRQTTTGQDGVRWPSMLIEKLAYLRGNVAVADFPPTDQHNAVYQKLHNGVMACARDLDRVMTNDVPAFTETLKKEGVGLLVTRKSGS